MLAPVADTVPEARQGLPWVLRARDPSFVGFVDWLEAHTAQVLQQLDEVGAVLIRGVEAAGPERFERIVRLLQPELQSEYKGTSPRDALTTAVHEASGLPGYYPIPQHCEMSFVAHPPDRLFFGCVQPPRRFGETPLVDMRRVAAGIREDVLAPMAELGLRIVRNYRPPGEAGGLFQLKPWDDIFGTTDRELVADQARKDGFEPTFSPDGALRLVNVQPPIVPHPRTGEPVWFNHLVVFHGSTGSHEYRRIVRHRPTLRHLALWLFSEVAVRRTRAGTAPDDLPMHVTYGDGTEIPDAHVDHVRDVIWANMVPIPWQAGDIVAIDNHAVAHGRLPYRGPRTIVVAWA